MVQGQGQGQGHSLHAAAALRWVCAQFQVRQQRQSTVVQQRRQCSRGSDTRAADATRASGLTKGS